MAGNPFVHEAGDEENPERMPGLHSYCKGSAVTWLSLGSHSRCADRYSARPKTTPQDVQEAVNSTAKWTVFIAKSAFGVSAAGAESSDITAGPAPPNVKCQTSNVTRLGLACDKSRRSFPQSAVVPEGAPCLAFPAFRVQKEALVVERHHVGRSARLS